MPSWPVVLIQKPCFHNNAGSILVIQIQKVNARAAFMNLSHLIIITVLFSIVVATDQMLTIAGMSITVIDYEIRASCTASFSPVYLCCRTERSLTNTVVMPRASASMCEHQSTLSSTCSHSRTYMATLLLPLRTARGSTEGS